MRSTKVRNFRPLIWIVTIVVYIVVMLLSYIPAPAGAEQVDWTFLPMLNAIFNSFTFLFLLAAWYFIRKNHPEMHRKFIYGALTTTTLFLISYLSYHFLTEETAYGGDGFLKYVYYFVLITHIVLAAVIVPMVLTSIARAINGQHEKHRSIARWTMPLWLYVSLSGVLVYVLLAPYY